MPRYRPRPLTPDEQLAQKAERIARDAAAAGQWAAALEQTVDDETIRLRKLQASLGITRFDEQPAAVPLLRVLRALTSGLAKIDAEIDLINIEQYLARGGPANKQALEERAAKRRAELGRDAAPTVQQPAGELPPEIQRALDVLANDQTAIQHPLKPAGRLAQLQDTKVIVAEGIRTVDAQLQELRSQAAYEQAARLQRRHGELLVELFRTAQRFAEKAADEQSLRAALVGAGYQPRYDLLPAPGVLSAILLLGRETHWDSQLSHYRRFLEERGLLR